MRTFYYVNGKRTNLEGYFRAGDTSRYNREALQKALLYFEKNPWELSSVDNVDSEEILATLLIAQYELTSEGRTFSKEWHEKNEKSLHRTYVIGFLLFLSIAVIGIGILLFSSNMPDYLEKYKITKENVKQGNNELVNYSTKTFSIQYPSEWELTEGDLGVIQIKSKTEDIGFSIVQFDPKLSFATIKQTRDSIKKDKGYEVGEKQTVIIDDTEVFETIYLKSNNGQSQAIMSYLFNKNGIVYNIEFNIFNTSDSKQIVLDIIETLHFTND